MKTYVQYDQTGRIYRVKTVPGDKVPTSLVGDYLVAPDGVSVQARSHKVVNGELVARSTQEISEDQASKVAERKVKKAAWKQGREDKIKPDAMKVKAKYPEVFDLLKVAGIIPESIGKE